MPAGVAWLPAEQADNTTTCGGGDSRSRSCTNIGPSARRNDENIGFPLEKLPWQTRWAMSTPRIASSTAHDRRSLCREDRGVRVARGDRVGLGLRQRKARTTDRQDAS